MPQARWTMIVLCCLANTINYIDRGNLAVAAPSMQRESGIDAAMMGLVLSGFFWTYSVMQMPFGWFTDRVGTRISLALAVVWWFAFTAVANSVATLLGCRLLLGVGEAGAHPSCAKVTANWFPRSERGLASSIFDSGSRIGSALSLPLVTWLIGSFGWRASFVTTGARPYLGGVLGSDLPRPGAAPLSDARAVAAPPGRARQRRHQQQDLLGLAVPLPHDLGHDDWVLPPELRHPFLHYLVPDPSGAGARLLARPARHLGRPAALVVIPGRWLDGFTSDALYRRGWSLTAARETCLVGGIQNFASNLAGIVTTTFTGVMLTITSGSFIVPLVVAGGFCLLGAAYSFLVGEIAPLPPLLDGSATHWPSAAE